MVLGVRPYCENDELGGITSPLCDGALTHSPTHPFNHPLTHSYVKHTHTNPMGLRRSKSTVMMRHSECSSTRALVLVVFFTTPRWFLYTPCVMRTLLPASCVEVLLATKKTECDIIKCNTMTNVIE